MYRLVSLRIYTCMLDWFILAKCLHAYMLKLSAGKEEWEDVIKEEIQCEREKHVIDPYSVVFVHKNIAVSLLLEKKSYKSALSS